MGHLCIATTRMPADLLRIALIRRHGCPDALTVHHLAPDRETMSPAAILLQPGGLQALADMGVEVPTLVAAGWTVRRCRVLTARGERLLEFDAAEASARWLPLWIKTETLRQHLARHAASAQHLSSAPAERSSCSHRLTDDMASWHRLPCAGTFLRRVAGALHDPTTQLLWDHPEAHIGLTHLTADELLIYAIPKRPEAKMVERSTCLRALDAAFEQLRPYVRHVGVVTEDQWFPLEYLGYRPCWDGAVLRWGPTTLRLHPLTGQWISHWAIQANRVAEALARPNGSLPRLAVALDRANKRVFHAHLRTFNYYTRPTLGWKVLYRPYAWLLRHSSPLRRRTMRRAALLV